MDRKEKTESKSPSTIDFVPFNAPYMTGNELPYLANVLERKELAGNGHYTSLVNGWLEAKLGTKAAFLTGAGTLALEMAALMMGLSEGDEIIMPSFTYVTSASAFVRSQLVPVFVDIRSDTLNIDDDLIESAITPKTRAILPVHYGGVACNMDAIMSLAQKNDLFVVEDAAHSILAKYKEEYLGTIAPLGVLSFHETKNIVGGEGGALLVNDSSLIDKARQIWLKGTNRYDMEIGSVSQYVWTELGSSFSASELTAAVVYAQLEQAESINLMRNQVWFRYHALLSRLEEEGFVKRPVVPIDCKHNGHIFYLLTESNKVRDELIEHLRKNNIESVFHYIPLHESPAGKRYGRVHGDLSGTTDISKRLIRLPMWSLLNEQVQEHIVSSIESFYGLH